MGNIIKKILYVDSNGVEKQIRPAWAPWANTIAYYPLQSDTNDYSWNSRNLTNSWVTFSDGVWIFNWSARAYISWNTQLNNWYTISFWEQSTVNNTSFMVDMRNNNQYWQWICALTEGWYFKIRQQITASSETEYKTLRNGNWNNWIITWDGTSNWKISVNWQLAHSVTIAKSIDTSNTTLSLWSRYSWLTNPFSWSLSEVIIENTPRTETEKSDYYNLTKSKYWL